MRLSAAFIYVATASAALVAATISPRRCDIICITGTPIPDGCGCIPPTAAPTITYCKFRFPFSSFIFFKNISLSEKLEK